MSKKYKQYCDRKRRKARTVQTLKTFEREMKLSQCGLKKYYRSIEQARDGAKMLNRNLSVKVEAYKCQHCPGWHVGRAFGQEV